VVLEHRENEKAKKATEFTLKNEQVPDFANENLTNVRGDQYRTSIIL
jgi:hypothetical protein